MQRAKVLFIGAGLLLAAGTAFADGDGDGSGSGSAAAGGGDAGGSGSAAAMVPAAGDAGGGEAMIDRHYVVGKGKIGAYGDFFIAHLSITAGAITVSATGEGIHVGGGFGLTDKITAGIDYTAPVAGDFTNKGKGPLALFGMFELAHSAKMSVAATADFTADLGGSDGMGGTKVSKAIHAGLGLKYLVAPKIAIFTGAPFGPGPAGQHLSISLESSGPINFSLPVGVGLQAMPKLFAYVDTNLLVFRIANKGMADAVSPIGSDIAKGGIGIPLTLGGFFAVNKMIDVGASLSFFDLAHAGDFYTIALGARYRN